MANMSYCRFRNTLSDLLDCVEALRELDDNNGVDRYGEELSYEERRAAEQLNEACAEFTDMYERVFN